MWCHFILCILRNWWNSLRSFIVLWKINTKSTSSSSVGTKVCRTFHSSWTLSGLSASKSIKNETWFTKPTAGRMSTAGFRWSGAPHPHCNRYHHRNNECHRRCCSWEDDLYSHNGFPLNTTPEAGNPSENFPSRQCWCTPCRIYIQAYMFYLSSGNGSKKIEIHKKSNSGPTLKEE